MQKLILIQFFILLGGTIFAWSNFVIELIDWMKNRACTTGCAAGAVNPFLTPCFYGALFFGIAFILSLMLLLRSTGKY